MPSAHHQASHVSSTSRLRRVRRWCTRCGLLGCLLLLQCTAPQPTPVHSAFDGVPHAIRIEPQFRDGLHRLTASQPWPLTLQADGMDWLLLGIKARWGDDGEERVWFVRVAEIIDPEEAEGGRRLQDRRFEYTVPFGVGAIRPDSKFTVRCRRLRIESYDASGEFIAAWSRLVPEVFPDASMYQALATLPPKHPSPGFFPLTAAPEQSFAEANHVALGARSDRVIAGAGELAHSDWATIEPQRMRDSGLYEMVATLQALGMTPPVAPIRDVVKDHIIQTPSLLTLLLAGLKPTATASMRHASPGSFPWVLDRVEVQCYQAEFSTYLAGERCFDCRVVVGPSVPPMHLIGGLLVIEAAHPHRPDNRLTVRVLASSRTRPGAN